MLPGLFSVIAEYWVRMVWIWWKIAFKLALI